MARVIIGTYMVRYPLGGNLSWALQQILSLKDLGHDVFIVEKYVYDESCYNPIQKVMSNDCSYGVSAVNELLKLYGLDEKWCFVQKGEIYHGLSKKDINEVFRSADVYIDSGANNAWAEEALSAGVRVLIDGDPGYTQFKYSRNISWGIRNPEYDFYFTNGKNVGRKNNIIPTAGIQWKHFYSPVKPDLYRQLPAAPNAPFSTVMNWQSFEPIEYNGILYGHKDVEFANYLTIPKLVDQAIEVAVSGKNVPHELLMENGWAVKDAQEVTISYNSFLEYLYYSKGEFSICKNIYVATASGWFSDKSAAYLAAGRPVILQDTGFSEHLPTGLGLFAFTTLDEAREAIQLVSSDYKKHCISAAEIATEYFDGRKLFKSMFTEIGV